MIEPIRLLNPPPIPQRFKARNVRTIFVPQPQRIPKRIVPKFDLPFQIKPPKEVSKMEASITEHKHLDLKTNQIDNFYQLLFEINLSLKDIRDILQDIAEARGIKKYQLLQKIKYR